MLKDTECKGVGGDYPMEGPLMVSFCLCPRPCCNWTPFLYIWLPPALLHGPLPVIQQDTILFIPYFM